MGFGGGETREASSSVHELVGQFAHSDGVWDEQEPTIGYHDSAGDGTVQWCVLLWSLSFCQVARVQLTLVDLAGAVGVARGAVQTIVDPTNESRAFTYMGLCWGLGGIVGSIVGGLTEHPILNFPSLFSSSTFLTDLFTEYPYLLPCLISGSVTFTGAILSLFLSPDGGAREGGIRLPTEKDVTMARLSISNHSRKLLNRFLPYFPPREALNPLAGTPTQPLFPSSLRTGSPVAPRLPSTMRSPLDMRKASNRQTRIGGSAYSYNPMGGRATGSAYGYGSAPGRRNLAMRMPSAATTTRYAPDYDQDLNFAQR